MARNGKADITLVYKEVIAIRDKMSDAQEASAKRWEAIAKVIGEHDACIDGHAKGIEELKDDVKYLERRDWKAGIIASIVGAAAGFFGSQR